MRAKLIVAALVAAGIAAPALAATPESALLEKLVARMEKLEARNAELEKEVKALKTDNDKVARALDSEFISENEPELTSRLKAVEKDALDMKKSAAIIEKVEGLKVGASLATVAQKAHGLPAGTENSHSGLNYRADVTAELPLKAIGKVEHKLFAHFRMGQGLGVNTPIANLGHFASAPNATAFRVSGANPDDSVALLAEAWYQASLPLPFGGFAKNSHEKLELTFGKLDIFGFFDQNATAGDESKQFLNSVFVHNPLLDAGGEVAVDANGFQPGFVASYVNETDKAEPWRLSVGVFCAGERGANFEHSSNSPLLMAQAEKQLKLFGGLTGNYRAYAWSRREATALDGLTSESHRGIGVSVNQTVSEGVSVFGRYGKLVKGEARFDQALALGAEVSGDAWGRGADAIGLAGSWLKASRAYRELGGSGDLIGDGSGTFSYLPVGAERVAELYYRYRVSPQLELTPDLQLISRAGANPDARLVKVVGLRANITY